jgi:NADH:ubiquinone oxidoreductase subunit 2 (subunit N)
MKLGIYVVGGFAVLGLCFVLLSSSQPPVNNPVVMLCLVALFGIPPLGAFWMMYMAIRHEKNPAPVILLAFIPFAFLWYYFDRFRSGKHKTRS